MPLSLYVVESCSKTALLIGLVLLRSHRFMRVTRGAKKRSRFPPVPALAYRWTRTGRWGAGQVRGLPDGRCARVRRARLPARLPGPAQRVDRGRHPGTARRPNRGPSTRSSSGVTVPQGHTVTS
jgi:hypothetical protein